MNRVLVCGGEHFIDEKITTDLEQKLIRAFGGNGFMFVLGVICTPAQKWAACQGVRVEIVSHSKWRAQNRRQLLLGADLVIAFEGGMKREHMVEAALEAKVEVWEPNTWVHDHVSSKFGAFKPRREYNALVFKDEELEIEGIDDVDYGPILTGRRIRNWK